MNAKKQYFYLLLSDKKVGSPWRHVSSCLVPPLTLISLAIARFTSVKGGYSEVSLRLKSTSQKMKQWGLTPVFKNQPSTSHLPLST